MQTVATFRLITSANASPVSKAMELWNAEVIDSRFLLLRYVITVICVLFTVSITQLSEGHCKLNSLIVGGFVTFN